MIKCVLFGHGPSSGVTEVERTGELGLQQKKICSRCNLEYWYKETIIDGSLVDRYMWNLRSKVYHLEEKVRRHEGIKDPEHFTGNSVTVTIGGGAGGGSEGVTCYPGSGGPGVPQYVRSSGSLALPVSVPKPKRRKKKSKKSKA